MTDPVLGSPEPLGGAPDASVKKLLSGREYLYPPNPPTPSAPGPESILDPLPIDRGLKADAWDAFHAAETPEEFQRHFDSLPLPKPAKADLFDLKFAIPSGAKTGPIGAPAPEPVIPTAAVTGPVREQPPAIPPEAVTGAIREQIPAIPSGAATGPVGGPKQLVRPGHGEPAYEIEPPAKGEPGMAETLGFGKGGYGAMIPHTAAGAPWSEQISRGAERFLAQTLNPKAASEMLAFMVGGEAVPAVAELPAVAGYLKDLPTVLKALDVFSKVAVPATLTGMGVKNIAQGGVPRNVEDAVVTAGNVLMAGLGADAAIRAGRAAIKPYTSDIPSRPPATVPGTQETIPPEAVGGIQSPHPAAVEAGAQALEAQGRNLAAQAWRSLNVKAPTEIDTNVGKIYLQPQTSTTMADGRIIPTATLLDATGKTVISGPPEAVRTWLDMHTGRVTGGLVRGEGGSGIIGYEPLPAHQMAGGVHAAGAAGEPVPVFGTNMAITTPVEGVGGLPIYDVINDDTGELLHRGPAETVSEYVAQNATIPNEQEYIKAITSYTKAVEQAAIKYTMEHPGTPHEEALRAVEGMVGRKPEVTDFQKPAEVTELPEAPAPPKPEKPEPPQKVAKIGPGTKNPPSAALPTEPESPATIALQMQQLAEGTRRVVMFPGGVGMPTTFPPNVRVTNDGLHTGNAYAYREDMTDASAIKHAAHSNTLTELLGHSELGMAAPDKSQLQGEPIAVSAHAPDGTEAQTTVTDAQSLPETVAAAHAVTPPGGTVEIKPPAEALADRTGEPAPVPVDDGQGDDSQDDTNAAYHPTLSQLIKPLEPTPQPVMGEPAPLGPVPAPVVHDIGPPPTVEGTGAEVNRVPLQHPLTYFSGKDSAKLRNEAATRGDVGLMVTPLKPEYLAAAGHYPAIAIDNGVFSKVTPFNPEAFVRLIQKAASDPAIKPKVQFVSAPDVVGDAVKTLELFDRWEPVIHSLGLPVAFVAQDGLENHLDEIPWDRIDTLFVGGSTEWKEGDVGQDDRARTPREQDTDPQFQRWASIFQEAERRGIPVHTGRVNTFRRMEGVHQFLHNASSADGTMLAYGEDKNWPLLEKWLDYFNHGKGPMVQLGGEPAEKPVPSGMGAATDKSVRDMAVRATVKDGQVNVTVRYQRKTVATMNFPVAEWTATERHPNPNYPQRQLAIAKLAGTNIADVVEQASYSNERMNENVVDRLANSVASAVREAVQKSALAAPAPVPTVPAEPTAEPAEGVTSEREAESGAEAAEPAGLENGSPGDAVREGSSEALAGVSPEDVQAAGGGGEPVPGGDVSGSIDSAAHGEPVEAGPPVRQSEGDRVPPVVPPAVGGGPAEPDIRPVTSADTRADYRLSTEDADKIENGSARTKALNNLEAIRTIKKIQAEGNRPATLEEQAKLAKYVGWGDSELAQGVFKRRREWAGIQQDLEDLLTPEEYEGAEESTINAHYTRRGIAAAMWEALIHMGFKSGGSVGEPGMGIGNFFMMMPESLQGPTRRIGIEIDPLTGSMAKALYPGSSVIVKPYQETNLPDGYFDAFIGNVPFQGGIEIYDPVFKREPYLTKGLHNYFFSKSMQKLRPGGVMLMITSRGTMDSPSAATKAFRTWMSRQGEFLGAIRLPRDTFKANAGTAVTVDVIAIRKGIPGQDPISTETWVESKPFDMGGHQMVDMNEYFHRHPEMMMGKMQPGSMYREGYPELFGTFSLDNFKDLLQTLPADAIPSWSAQPEEHGHLVETYPEADFIKDGGYAWQNGQLVRREGSYMQPQTGLSATRIARARGLIDIRGAAREVLRTQDMEAPEPIILAARQHLNDVYDKFVNTKIGKDKTFGPINSYANVLALGQDPDWPLLSALEKWDKNTKTAEKMDIFSTRTKVRPKPVESVETGTEALAVSLNELGRLDWDRMQQLTGRTPQELIKELEGQIFRNPISKRWETADEYLSGNVRQKLSNAEFAAKDQPEYAANIEALKAVQPTDLKPGDIDATLGATWIPASVYNGFVNDLLKSEGATVKLIPLTGGYAVEEPRHFSDKGVANRIEYGTPYFSGMDLFEMAMNGISPVARDEVEDFEGNKKLVKNPKATIEAVDKQRRIMREFSEWFWTDADRATIMARKYNLERNNLRLREYNGSHLTFPGLNRTWMHKQADGERGLDAHQKNAIWRIIQSGNTLLAHAVGAGKTLEMIVAAMEMKRLGQMRKPMIVVPNHLVGQWRNDFLRAYPSAQILVPTKASFEAKKRARLMSQIATGNYDAVIVGHKAFELLPVKDETFENFMNAQIEEVENAIAAASEGKSSNEAYNDPTTKQLVRRKKQLEERLKKRANRAAKDVTVTFEEMGVDGLFVDEAHAFKNLGYMTMMDRIAGLPNTDAGRSVDMLLKSQYVNQLHGNNRGVVFATGTPVSNSLAEIWTMMRYLMPQYMKDEGFDQFDAWAKTFGRKITDMEVAPEGNRMISRTRFADFVNAPELMNMFRIVADVRTKEQLNLPTPAILGGGETDVVVPASRGLKNFISLLGERADAVRSGGVKPEEDNMLKISSDGRKASLDLRLVDATAREDKNSKAHAAVENILKLYKEFDQYKAAQLVFLDLSTPKAEGKKKKAGAVANVDQPEGSPVVNADKPEAPPAIANAEAPEGTEPEEELDLYGEKEPVEQQEDTDTDDEKRERFTVYSQIKKNLIAGGIPANEIAFIHDVGIDPTGAKKSALFAAVRDGRVRVLMGSTEKMGAGMNVQDRLIALHHLDAPWRPADWEQRNGRIDRQGNMLWDEHQIPIRIFRYMTEGSFDAFMWQTIVAKARPITRFMNGDPSVRRVEEPAVSVMSAEQAMAVSSGNPEVREKIILDQEIGRIEILRGAWMNEQANIAQTLATVPGQITASKALNAALQGDIATRNADKTLKVEGKDYEGGDIRKDGAAALIGLLKGLGPVGEVTPINAAYHGFTLQASPVADAISAFQTEDKEHLYLVEKKTDGLLYSEVANPNPQKAGIGYTRQALELRTLSKKEAETIHALVPTGLTRKAGQLKYWGQIEVLSNPNVRLVSASHNYAVSANYENPSGTIASADYVVRGFEEDLQNSQGNLRRLEKQKVELESKQGQPFRDEEKLMQMVRRQRELAEKLGEDKDDAQAIAGEDEDNPLTPLLADPTSAMLPEWFPSRKIYVAGDYGVKTPEKVNIINQNLGVQPVKIGRSTRYSVVHIPTGQSLGSFSSPQDAVAFARQAADRRDWNTAATAEIRDWARDFRDTEFQPPTETPKESVARLVKPVEPESPEQRSGPIARYEPLKRKLPTPEYIKGEKGWMQAELDGKKYSISGIYAIQGEIAPISRSTAPSVEVIKKLLAGNGEPTIKPVAFSTATLDGKDNRIIWFSNGKPMDARYYEDIRKRFPGATFAGGTTGKVYINDKNGQRIGVAVMPAAPDAPESIKSLIAPPPKVATPAAPGRRSLVYSAKPDMPPYNNDVLARPRTDLMHSSEGRTELEQRHLADAKFEQLLPGQGHVYVNRAGMALIEEVLEQVGHPAETYQGITVGWRTAQVIAGALENGARHAPDEKAKAAINRVLAAFKRGQDSHGVVTIVNADPDVATKEVLNTRREEVFHRQQLIATYGEKEAVDVRGLKRNSLLNRAYEAMRDSPRNKGKHFSDQRIFHEVGAALATGQEAELGLTQAEGVIALRMYLSHIEQRHGEQAADLLNYVLPRIRRAMGGKYARVEGQIRQARRSGYGNKGPQSADEGPLGRPVQGSPPAREPDRSRPENVPGRTHYGQAQKRIAPPPTSSLFGAPAPLA